MGAFGAKTAAQVVLIFTAAALVWIGIAFIAYGIAVALTPALGMAGGATVAGAILLVGPLMWVMITLLRASAPPEEKEPKTEHGAVMGVLAALAKDKPLIAMGVAALVGAADMLLKRRSKS